MTILTRKSNHLSQSLKKMPHKVSKQLERIYNQSARHVKKHPYQAASELLVSVGLVTCAFALIRYIKGK